MVLKRIMFNTEGLGGGGTPAPEPTTTPVSNTSNSSSTDVNSTTTQSSNSTGTEPQSLNTGSKSVDDVNEAKIPRARLNEVLQQKKELEERLSKFEQNYKAFDEVYNSVPEFQEAINKVVNDYQEGKITKKQAEAKMDNIQSQQETASKEGQLSDEDLVSFKDVKKLMEGTKEDLIKQQREFATKQYSQLFSAEVGEFLGIKPEQYSSMDEFAKLEVKMMNDLINEEMMKKNPNAFNYFDANLMKQSIAKAKETYKKMGEKQLLRFQQTKQDTAQPSIDSAPAPGNDRPNFATMSREERTAWLLEQQQKGQS